MKCSSVRFIQCIFSGPITVKYSQPIEEIPTVGHEGCRREHQVALVFALPIGVAVLQPGVDGSGCWEALCAIEGRFCWVQGCGAVVDMIFFIDFECRRAANGMIAGA